MINEICIRDTGEIISIKKFIAGVFFTKNNAYLENEVLINW